MARPMPLRLPSRVCCFEMTVARRTPIGNYIADFYCHKAKLVVEIDGWRHFTEDGLDYDEKRTAYFETRGLKVVRYRGAAVDADIEAVARQIEEMARTRIAELER